jgi:hypothetical protein
MPPIMYLSRRFLIVVCTAMLLAGCQSNSVGNAALQTLRAAIWGVDQPTGAGLDPRFSYIRVTTNKSVAFLALGYVDPHPQGPIEVWYSAEREVIRLQNGRLVGATGTLTEWRQVRGSAFPSWRVLAQRAEPYLWTRTRDVMPGYQFNTRDELQLRVTAPPPRNALQGVLPESLTWFEESLLSTTAAPADITKPARYAVDLSEGTERVIYAEQCISSDICLTWQRWVAGQ